LEYLYQCLRACIDDFALWDAATVIWHQRSSHRLGYHDVDEWIAQCWGVLVVLEGASREFLKKFANFISSM
jgi:hypothetical protein